MKRVEDISVIEYLNFINNLHGEERLDKFILKKGKVEITRSSMAEGCKYKRVSNHYTFCNKANGNFAVVWIGANGRLTSLSDEFSKFMHVAPVVEDLDDEMDMYM